jgi:hypothetical protein
MPRHLLTHLPRNLARRYDGAVPSGRRVVTDAIDCKIRAEKNASGRWSYDEADEPVIAAFYGMTPRRAEEPKSIAA